LCLGFSVFMYFSSYLIHFPHPPFAFTTIIPIIALSKHRRYECPLLASESFKGIIANTQVVYLSKTLEWKCKYLACLYVKELWIKMWIPRFLICQRPGLITWVYSSGFLPNNHFIYLGKSDYQTPAPGSYLTITMFLEPQPRQSFKMWKCKYLDLGGSFPRKNRLMPRPSSSHVCVFQFWHSF
jgi:hypothetical protein